MKNYVRTQHIYIAEYPAEIRSFLRLNFYTLDIFYRFFKTHFR